MACIQAGKHGCVLVKKGVAACNNQTRRSIFSADQEEAEAYARHIVLCVNYHDRLLEALVGIVDSWANGEGVLDPIKKASNLLDEIYNLEDR